MTRRLVFGLMLLSAAPLLAAEPPAAKPVGDKEKVICRREAPIGSLIATRKTCMTKAEWEQRARDGNEEARKMIYDNQGRPSGN